jgi:hypothetical protein
MVCPWSNLLRGMAPSITNVRLAARDIPDMSQPALLHGLTDSEASIEQNQNETPAN